MLLLKRTILLLAILAAGSVEAQPSGVTGLRRLKAVKDKQGTK